MSHVAHIDLHVKDLDCLREACKELGLEFREGQTTWRWFGKWMDDYHDESRAAALQGFDPKRFGLDSIHAIGVPGNSDAYEIGVIPRQDGKPGFTLLYDNYCAGNGLENLTGRDLKKLKTEYGMSVGKKKMLKKGYRYAGRKTLANGRQKQTFVK